MHQGVISELFIYPVKALQGIALQEAELTAKGLKWDRFWMIVNEDGLFVSQRHFSDMACIKTEIDDEYLTLSHPDFESLKIPLSYSGDQRAQAKVWSSDCQVFDEGEIAQRWLTSVLGLWRGQKLRLVRMATDFNRSVSEKHTEGASNITYFADGYPYLVCNTASLQALNHTLSELGEAVVPMSRFRGNIMVESQAPFIEHNTKQLVLQDQPATLALNLCKPCERCKVTAIDQQTGNVAHSQQPLKTLFGMTHVDKKGAFFGQNAVVLEQSKENLPAIIKVGDIVTFTD